MRKHGLAEREGGRRGRGWCCKEPLFSPEVPSQLWAGTIVARADGITCQVFPKPEEGRSTKPLDLEGALGRDHWGSESGRKWHGDVSVPGRCSLQIEVELSCCCCCCCSQFIITFLVLFNLRICALIVGGGVSFP